MRGENQDTAGPSPIERRGARRPRPRRPWALIAACGLLVLLSAVLWLKWRDSRGRVVELDAELKKVYAEAESLRTEAALAKQRIGQLEQQLRALSGDRGRPAPRDAKPTNGKRPTQSP
jgi:hypothetical protein